MSFDQFTKFINLTASGSMQIIDTKGRPIIVEFKYNHPSSIDDLMHLEKQGVKISDEHKSLLRISNGFEIYCYRGVDGFRVYGTGEIAEKTEWVSNSFKEDWDSTVIIGGKIIGEGAYLGFRELSNGKSEVLDCFLENMPGDWHSIASSISDFLIKLINANGNKYW